MHRSSREAFERLSHFLANLKCLHRSSREAAKTRQYQRPFEKLIPMLFAEKAARSREQTVTDIACDIPVG